MNPYIKLSIALVLTLSVLIIPQLVYFHIFDEVKTGEKYLIIYHENDPFETQELDTLYVVDVRTDWVKWKQKYVNHYGDVEYAYFTGKKRTFLNITDHKIK